MPKSNKMLTLPGGLTITRRGSDAEAQIVIVFDDEKSRSQAASITVSPADFAMALTGLAAVPGSGLQVAAEARRAGRPHPGDGWLAGLYRRCL
jgi:hypothetical protein